MWKHYLIPVEFLTVPWHSDMDMRRNVGAFLERREVLERTEDLQHNTVVGAAAASGAAVRCRARSKAPPVHDLQPLSHPERRLPEPTS